MLVASGLLLLKQHAADLLAFALLAFVTQLPQFNCMMWSAHFALNPHLLQVMSCALFSPDNVCTADNSNIKITGQKGFATTQLFKQKTLSFESLGIGGLDKQFDAIFRRAFASRVFPPSIVQRLGIQHVKVSHL
jgi:hypothetical protein